MSEIDDLLAHLDREAKNPGADYLPFAEVAKVLRVHTAALRRELAAAQEARLAAELRAEGQEAELLALRLEVATLRAGCEAMCDRWEQEAENIQENAIALDPVLPPSKYPSMLGSIVRRQDAETLRNLLESEVSTDLAPLRNLVRELLAATNLPPGQRFPDGSPNRRLADALAELLAAYPALDPGAEPAGEVPRG